MKLHQSNFLCLIWTSALLGACGSRPSESSDSHETIEPNQITRASVKYHVMDGQTVTIVTASIPDSLLNQFVNAWNNSAPVGICKFPRIFTMEVQFTDGTSRSFMMNEDHVKERDDHCYQLSDTTISTGLTSLRAINERWYGTYATDNNARLALHRNGFFDYSFSQCTRGAWSHGTWTASGDTLHLRAHPDSLAREDAMFKYTYFKEPFVLKGRQLFFTVDHELNWHHFFTKE